MSDLTHHEGHVLALIRKWQPATAYFVRKTLERGLASSFSGSPGSVYPIIERLKRQDLVRSAAVADDKRGSQQLECTEKGMAAVQAWIVDIQPADLLPEDPWRTRISFAEVLSPEQQRAWLRDMRNAARMQAEALQGLCSGNPRDLPEAALENARMLNEARLRWIEQTIEAVGDQT